MSAEKGESEQAASSSSQANTSTNDGSPKKRLFTKDLRCMMFGFGDDQVPYTETVDLLEDIVIDYIQNLSLRALEVGKAGRINLEDVWYLLRRDPRKYARVKELLAMNEELKKARKAFDEDKY